MAAPRERFTAYLGPDGKPYTGELIGSGLTGVIIPHGPRRVLKIPLLYNLTAPDATENDELCNSQNQETIDDEKKVYQHLGLIDGVISARVVDAGIELPYMENGDLFDYLGKGNDISQFCQFDWIYSVAKTIRDIHQKHVLVNDIASRNLLVDHDLSLKLCDFGNARIISDEETEFEEWVEYGSSVKNDVAQFGSLIYEIVTGGKEYHVLVNPRAPFDVTDVTQRDRGVTMWFPYWPPKNELASTAGLFLGDIIMKCWLKDGFKNMDEVCRVLADVQLTKEGSPVCKHQQVSFGAVIILNLAKLLGFPFYALWQSVRNYYDRARIRFTISR